MPSPSIQMVDELFLLDTITGAKQRLVYIAPGVSDALAGALTAAWKRLGKQMSVILDADAGCCRLGYGTESGLKALYGAATQLGFVVCHQPGLRVGLVVTEAQTVIFTPTPLLIEDGGKRSEGANAIVLMGEPPAMLAQELGIGPKGVADQTIGLDGLTKDKINGLAENLKANPPLPFDVSRHMMVYNAALEFVEFGVAKIQFQSIDIPIPAELSGFTSTELRALFRFDPGPELTDAKKKIEDKKREIEKEFTRAAPGFGGSLIERSRKKDFLDRVSAFRPEFDTFRTFVERNFMNVSVKNQAKLHEALLPRIVEVPPADWGPTRGTSQERKRALSERLSQELETLFGKRQKELVSGMRIDVLFKGVTYECLNDPRFKEVAKKAFPHLASLHTEEQAAPEHKG